MRLNILLLALWALQAAAWSVDRGSRDGNDRKCSGDGKYHAVDSCTTTVGIRNRRILKWDATECSGTKVELKAR